MLNSRDRRFFNLLARLLSTCCDFSPPISSNWLRHLSVQFERTGQQWALSLAHSTTNLLTISYIAWIVTVRRSTGMRSSTPCTRPSLLGVLR